MFLVPCILQAYSSKGNASSTGCYRKIVLFPIHPTQYKCTVSLIGQLFSDVSVKIGETSTKDLAKQINTKCVTDVYEYDGGKECGNMLVIVMLPL